MSWFSKRRESPDLDGLERHLGYQLPKIFCALYANRELAMSNDICIVIPNPLENDDECYICWFEPADIENLKVAWPECEGLFPFANNGAGDQYLIDLRQEDPEVLYLLHETGEMQSLGVTLSVFLAAPRHPAPD